MGHTSADYETAMASVNAGVKHVTHLFNAMTPLAHRAPGVVTAAMNADISCEKTNLMSESLVSIISVRNAESITKALKR